MSFMLIAHISWHVLSLLAHCLRSLLDALCIIFTCHTAPSIGFKRMHSRKYFDVNYLVGSLPKKLVCILTAFTFHFLQHQYPS